MKQALGGNRRYLVETHSTFCGFQVYVAYLSDGAEFDLVSPPNWMSNFLCLQYRQKLLSYVEAIEFKHCHIQLYNSQSSFLFMTNEHVFF